MSLSLIAHLQRRSSSSCSLGPTASRWGRDYRVGDLAVVAEGAKGEEEAGSREREEEASSKQQAATGCLDWSWKGEEEASSREEGGSSTNSNSVADG